MSFQEQTKEAINAILLKEFNPTYLEVINDSAAHAGHAFARDTPQAGHFKVIMTSELFNNLSPIKRHRLVYEKLNNLMDTHIHALSMTLSALNE
jgi:BolA protein